MDLTRRLPCNTRVSHRKSNATQSQRHSSYSFIRHEGLLGTRGRSHFRANSYNQLYDVATLAPEAIAVSGALAVLTSIAAGRIYLYSRLELLIATFMGRMVPVVGGEGAKVLQLGGSTKELFYYPSATALITVVDEGANPSLYEQAGLQAMIGTVAKQQSPASLAFAADASADAVVALRSIGRLPPASVLPALSEIHRVLKPGAPLIFVERVADDGASLRPALGSFNGLLGPEFFQELKESKSFDIVKWDVEFQGLDPHAVGVAIKAATGSGSSQAVSGGRQRRKQAAAAKASDAVGFGP